MNEPNVEQKRCTYCRHFHGGLSCEQFVDKIAAEAVEQRERAERLERDVESVQRALDDEKRDRLLLVDELTILRGELQAANALLRDNGATALRTHADVLQPWMTLWEKWKAMVPSEFYAACERLVAHLRGETPAQPPCIWTEDDDEVFNTTCGHSITFYDGPPAANEMRWCTYCGATLRIERHDEQADDYETTPPTTKG